MQINTFTLIAQIVNFLILVGLLSRFLYGPIVRTMDAREQKIAARLAEADQKRLEAEKDAQSYRQKQRQLEAGRAEFMVQAKKDAENRKTELMTGLRAEVAQIRADWYEALAREKVSFLSDLRRRTGQQVYAVARRALTDLADADLEKHIIDVFIERLRGLSNDERREIAGYVTGPGEGLVVYTAFDIPAETQDWLTAAIREAISPTATPRFEKFSDLICGIELKAGGHKTSWSLASYVKTLEEDLSRAFIEEEQAVTKAGEIGE